jgi:hypothetical protein
LCNPESGIGRFRNEHIGGHKIISTKYLPSSKVEDPVINWEKRRVKPNKKQTEKLGKIISNP